MEQRRLRLGDILDDYCPRERRVTNHAVVAMIEDTVKQTRCTTCDAEHPYKGGQAPRRKKKETSAALYKEVLAGKPDTDAAASGQAPEADDVPIQPIPAEIERAPETPLAATSEESDESDESSDAPLHDVDPALPVLPDVEEGPVHRPLIRATLPRPEGQKDARPLPEFTVRQSGGRGNNAGNQQFRGGNRPRHGHNNGHRPQGGQRFTGARPGQGRGQGGNFRSAQQSRQGGGRKRSR